MVVPLRHRQVGLWTILRAKTCHSLMGRSATDLHLFPGFHQGHIPFSYPMRNTRDCFSIIIVLHPSYAMGSLSPGGSFRAVHWEIPLNRNFYQARVLSLDVCAVPRGYKYMVSSPRARHFISYIYSKLSRDSRVEDYPVQSQLTTTTVIGTSLSDSYFYVLCATIVEDSWHTSRELPWGESTHQTNDTPRLESMWIQLLVKSYVKLSRLPGPLERQSMLGAPCCMGGTDNFSLCSLLLVE